MYFLGMDVGSLSCDALIVDDSGRIISSSVVPTGATNMKAISWAREEALALAGLRPEDLAATVATGYGRDRVEGRIASVTEISCHARGIKALVPGAELLIDIGGQDSKAIMLGREGQVLEFAMNDKCAAGTGRFLDAMARTLEIEVVDLGRLDAHAEKDLTLSSMCTVFAESEVVSLVATGTSVAEIVRGMHRAVASRTQSLVRRVTPTTNGLKVAMSGGVARNAGVVRALSEVLGCTIDVPAEPDTVGAYGAALYALDRFAASTVQ